MTPDTTSLKSLSERLLAGAKILGNLWRRGIRCKNGWDVSSTDLVTAAGITIFPCGCTPRTEFCKARIQWLSLSFMACREDVPIVEGLCGLFYSMSAKEWDATGLTATVESEKAGTLRIGSRGTISTAHLTKLSQDPASAVSIFSLTKAFPKARIEGVVEPPQEAIA